MTSEVLLKYISEAEIFDIALLEEIAGIENESLSSALSGKRDLTDSEVSAIAWTFKQLGIDPFEARF
jgi:hypothetical protein